MTEVIRIALFGPPGAGKSTIRRLSQSAAEELGLVLHHFRLADPLYIAQAEIYRIAGRPLSETDTQDGHLLNLLGVEMRRINPSVLADHARARIVQIGRLIESEPGTHAIICDDMRPLDAHFMHEMGFDFVLVHAGPAIAEQRRRVRGDLTLGDRDDPIETGFESLQFTASIDNDGSMESLVQRTRAFWKALTA